MSGILQRIAAVKLAQVHARKRDLPEYEAARGGYWAQRFRAGAALFERARARGELRADVDPVLALETLVATSRAFRP